MMPESGFFHFFFVNLDNADNIDPGGLQCLLNIDCFGILYF
jgi:hypothetical protein